MKTCFRCSTAKPLNEFGNDKNRADGKYPTCRDCVRVANKAARKRHNAKRTEYNRQYRTKNRAQHNDWERNYFAKNKEALSKKSKRWREGNGAFTIMHLGARGRAHKKGIPYELTPALIGTICEVIQGGKCALTGVPFDYSDDGQFRFRPFAPSIDRKDSSKGYTVDNVQITCVIVNKAKNEYPQEMFDAMCLARAKVLNAQV
jgi:hypothetical protein